MLKKLTQPVFGSLAVAVLSLSILMVPQRSNAAIGVIALLGGPGAIPILEIGGAVTAAGFTTALADSYVQRNNNGDLDEFGWTGMFVFFGGLVILGQNGNYMDMHYSQVTNPAQIKALGLNAAEVKALSPEGELSDINGVQQSIAQELRSMKNPTRADAAALWTAHEQNGEISAAALSAVAKINLSLMNGASTLTPVASH